MRDWIKDPPQEERMVEVTTPSGDVLKGIRRKDFFYPCNSIEDATMYAYFSPVRWRYI